MNLRFMRTSIFIKHINVNMHDLRTETNKYTLTRITQRTYEKRK